MPIDEEKEEADLARTYDADVKINYSLLGQLMAILIRRVYKHQIIKHSLNEANLLQPEQIVEQAKKILKLGGPAEANILPAILQSMNTMLLKLVLVPGETLSKQFNSFIPEDHLALNDLTTIWLDVIQLLAAKMHDDTPLSNRENAVLVGMILYELGERPTGKLELAIVELHLPDINQLERQIFAQFEHKLPMTGDPKAKLQMLIEGIIKDPKLSDMPEFSAVIQALKKYLEGPEKARPIRRPSI